MSPAEYEAKKERVANQVVARVEALAGLPGLQQATLFREVGKLLIHEHRLL